MARQKPGSTPSKERPATGAGTAPVPDEPSHRILDHPAPGGDPLRPEGRDESFRATGTRVGELDSAAGAVAPGARNDDEGAIADQGMDRDAGAGAAAGHDSSVDRGHAAGRERDSAAKGAEGERGQGGDGRERGR